VTLENLRAGVPWQQAGVKDNPYIEWIGADIRADPWGYAAPGLPSQAGEMAYRDAILSHRRNGVYGAMYFAAAIAAAFATDDPMEACRIATSEIPQRCRLHEDLCWALDNAKGLSDHLHARSLVDERFGGMSHVHTNNNACLTIFGLALGGRDVTRVIGTTVAMGMDNDCTAATAGSIVGASVGADNIPEHWYGPFNGKVRTYINGHEWFTNVGIVDRFASTAAAVWRHSEKAS
jgi:ADP-ribosylglycohydrolase